MNSSPEISIFVSMFVSNLPNFMVCIVAIVLVLSKRTQLGRAATWALLGFGLSLVLCVVVPLVQAVVQSWVIQNGSMVRSAALFGGIAFLWSVLRAATYVMLLMAVVAGRTRTASAVSPALPGQV